VAEDRFYAHSTMAIKGNNFGRKNLNIMSTVRKILKIPINTLSAMGVTGDRQTIIFLLCVVTWHSMC
jgi:hypothetical protein